jgi:hypothetical protein
MAKRFSPTLEDCEDAIDYLEDAGNYDVDDEHRASTLRVRIHDYPLGSAEYFLVLTYYGDEKPNAGEIPTPPNWRLDSEWFSTEIERKGITITAWQVGLIFQGVDE